MSAQQIGIGIVALLVIAGGAFFLLSSQQSSDTMMKEDESGEMVQKEDAMMEGDAKDDAMTKDTSDDAMMKKEDSAMMEKGTYQAYSPEKLTLANEGKVVLYFHADWCPICRPLDAALETGVPSGVHILKVNYDTATELKQKYGVTYQHTFVQVDAAGKLIAKWGDAFTAADVFARIK